MAKSGGLLGWWLLEVAHLSQATFLLDQGLVWSFWEEICLAIYPSHVCKTDATWLATETAVCCLPKMESQSAAAKSLQSCLTLCDPIDGSPPGSPVPVILQARTLEWAAISFSSAWKWKAKVKSLSRVRLLATPWTAAHQASPSMRFSRQECWSGVPLPSPECSIEYVK